MHLHPRTSPPATFRRLCIAHVHTSTLFSRTNPPSFLLHRQSRRYAAWIPLSWLAASTSVAIAFLGWQTTSAPTPTKRLPFDFTRRQVIASGRRWRKGGDGSQDCANYDVRCAWHVAFQGLV